MLGDISPDGYDILLDTKNKYLDMSVDDVLYEIKTLSVQTEFNSKSFNDKFIQSIKFRLNDIIKHEIESKARYVIFNSVIYYYVPDEEQIKNSLFGSLFWNNSKNLARKWIWSSNMFNVRVQDLFVYDLLNKDIIYINEDSYLFKKTPVDFYNIDTNDEKYKYGQSFSINLHTKFTEKMLRDKIRI